MNNLTETSGNEETEKQYACKFCSKKYKLPTRLHAHEKLCLSPASQEKSCKTCGQSFKQPKRLQKHELMHTLDHKFSCKFCSWHFSTKHELNVHKADEHSDKVQRRRCKLCPNSVFNTKEEYFVHVNEEHKGQSSDYHMCSDCGKQFKTKSELNNHNKSLCGTVKQFKCEVCDQKLMTPGSLFNHMLRHTVKCSNMCGYCGKMFLTIGQLRVHERTHTQDKAFVCSVCGKGFCHRQSLITHSSLHTGVKPYQCENCGSAFSCVGNLIKHRRTHADTCGGVPLTSHRVSNPTTKLKVKINTPTTSKISALKKQREMNEKLAVYKIKIHQRMEPAEAKPTEMGVLPEQLASAHSEESVKDEPVDTKPKEMEVLLEQLSSANLDEIVKEELIETKPTEMEGSVKEETPPPVVPKKRKKKRIGAELGKDLRYTCQDCNRRFGSVRQLARHEKSHGRSQTNLVHECSCCKNSFESHEECKEHQRSEHADILSCQDCDKIFSNVDSLRSHVRFFHKGLPKKVYVYICDKCGVQFRQKLLLRHHEQNNCERAPMYGCEICGKRFHSVHTRKSHLRIHDPKKKFLCKFCGKSFRWKGQLKVHERSHTGEKPFKCLYCPKAFGYRESLITHSSLHTGIKPHLCQACGSRFSCVGNLIKHRATHSSTCGVWYAKNK